MNQLEFLLAVLRDSRLAAYVLGETPAWLWTVDGARIVFANPVGAAIFGGEAPTSLADRNVGEETAGRQMARLAGALPHGGATRLERLRGFGAGFGRALLCTCANIDFDGRRLILVAAAEPAGPNFPLAERMRRLFAGCEDQIAVFSDVGALLHATASAKPLLGATMSLEELGAVKLAADAAQSGSAQAVIDDCKISIERIVAGTVTILIATLSKPDIAARPADIDISPIAQAMARAAKQESASLAPKEAVEGGQEFPGRRHPLRFIWQMDSEGRFSLGSDEFTEVIGSKMATALGRRWTEIASDLQLDPERQIERALASQETWSGITVAWPVEGSTEYLPVEMSGLPVFDRDRSFRGFRGFGVCRDVARLSALIAARRETAMRETATPAAAEPGASPPIAEAGVFTASIDQSHNPKSDVQDVQNVVPFRALPLPQPGPAILTLVEDNAFRELAQELTERLRGDSEKKPTEEIEPRRDADPMPAVTPNPDEIVQAVSQSLPPARDDVVPRAVAAEYQIAAEPVRDKPSTENERPILDRIPLGILVYRLDEFLYANRAFLEWTGYATLDEFVQAGGLENLFLDGDIAPAESDGPARSLTITPAEGGRFPLQGRLFSITWGGDGALALIFSTISEHPAKPSIDGARSAEAVRELESILDIATDGVILLDRDGRILSSNRSAEALFGYDAKELAGRNLSELFAPESQPSAARYFQGIAQNGVASLLNDGREVIGRVREGGLIPLFMTMGRVSDGAGKFSAVFRDITQWKKAEEELVNAKQQAEKASTAKSEFLAKISHEIRTPLNAIIGFSEVMMDERFGPIGNERYREYLKDIHASGAHLVSLLNDLLDLSKIEAGKLDLTFADVNLNELTQQCVALMQQQANDERIIIRTSLSPTLSPIIADARSVRQIVLNLLSNSIKFTGAGGQVIVSTALTDQGEVALRVRDTGVGMSEKELLTALQPFRQIATSTRPGAGGTGLGLPLTKALAEANRARFNIRSAVSDGTLVEIVFPAARVAAT